MLRFPLIAVMPPVLFQTEESYLKPAGGTAFGGTDLDLGQYGSTTARPI